MVFIVIHIVTFLPMCVKCLMVYMEDTFTDVAIFACPCEMLNQWFVYMEDFFFFL